MTLQIIVSTVLMMQCLFNYLNAAQTKLTITINDQVFTTSVEFSRANDFFVTINYDFSDIVYVKRASVKSKYVPAKYLTINTNTYSNTIDITLDYPDPFFTHINFDTISFTDIKLYIDFEDETQNREIFEILSKKNRTALLLQIAGYLKPSQFLRYEDVLLTGIAYVYVMYSSNAAEGFIALIKKENKGTAKKIDIIDMVMGFATPADIITMRDIVSADAVLKSFVKILQARLNDDEVVNYLLSGA